MAHSDTYFGTPVEQDWNPFTAKMVARSGAQVLPIYFPGRNSQAYQIANKLSATLRQGLLLYEIRRALNKRQSPVIGRAFSADELRDPLRDPRRWLAEMREHTLNLRG